MLLQVLTSEDAKYEVIGRGRVGISGGDELGKTGTRRVIVGIFYIISNLLTGFRLLTIGLF